MTEQKTTRQRATRFALAAIGSLALAGAAFGDIKYPLVTLEIFASNDGQPSSVYTMHMHSDHKNQVGENVFNFAGGSNGLNDKWGLQWDINVSPSFASGNTAGGGGGGSFINLANLAVTNTSNQDQVFWVLVTLSLDEPINVPTFSKGDVAATVQSFINQGATLRNVTTNDFADFDVFAGDPIYEAYIDGSPVHSLMDSTTITSVGSQTASETDAFGQDGTFMTGPALETIGIWLKIEVSAFSIATVIGQYEIMPIPAPAVLPLLGLAALGLRRRRRD